MGKAVNLHIFTSAKSAECLAFIAANKVVKIERDWNNVLVWVAA